MLGYYQLTTLNVGILTWNLLWWMMWMTWPTNIITKDISNPLSIRWTNRLLRARFLARGSSSTCYTKLGRSFFLRDLVNADAHIYERTLTSMNVRTHTLPLWAPLKNWVGPANLEIDEVTTGASLSMDKSSTTERITPLDPRINPEKWEHPCQVSDSNPGGQVPPQGTHNQLSFIPHEMGFSCNTVENISVNVILGGTNFVTWLLDYIS
jgi:hypothetical protein